MKPILARSALLVGLLALSSCGKVKDPTPKGTVIIDWNHGSAVAFVPGDLQAKGPRHPLADAKVIGEPVKRAYTITVTDPEKKAYVVELTVESAKVSYPIEGKDEERWATLEAHAEVSANDAFHISGYCDDRVATVLGAPGQITNTMLECHVVAKRPNSMGTVDAITMGAFLQVEGTGKLIPIGDEAKITEHDPAK